MPHLAPAGPVHLDLLATGQSKRLLADLKWLGSLTDFIMEVAEAAPNIINRRQHAVSSTRSLAMLVLGWIDSERQRLDRFS